MNRSCGSCGKQIEGEGVAFCPYCGAKLAAGSAPETRNPEAEKWVSKALAAASYPERKKILLKGLEACPGSREIEWELLFIGEPEKNKVWSKGIDYSIIKSWILEIYRTPEEFPDEKRERMHAQLYDAPELARIMNRFEHPEEKQQEYLQRLCREYVELFLEGSNLIMGNLFGFRIERNKEKRLAAPVAQMIGRIRADEKLLPEQREQLWKALYQAYGTRTGGKMEYLDELIMNNE